MPGMTIVEKIFARNSGEEHVKPGDFVVVDVDVAVMLDMSFLATERRNILKVHDPDKIAVIFDHMVPAADRRSAEAHAHGRDFVRRFGIRRFHDVGPEQGISHAVVADCAYALPGTVLVCSDSHTCASGAFNCAARGIGAPDLLAAVTTGKTWFRVGETMRYELSGVLRRGVSAKDLFLHLAGTWATIPTRMSSSAARRFPALASTHGVRWRRWAPSSARNLRPSSRTTG